jgi:chorismate--pyruvate lyase
MIAFRKISRQLPSSSRWLKKPLNSGLYRKWLTDKGSLTRKLQMASASFAVKPIRYSAHKPLRDEAKLLNLGPQQKAWVREVDLYSNHKPVVFAHSILPHGSLCGNWQGLGRLGNRPLGGALFSNPKVKRTQLEFKKLTANHPLYRIARQHLKLLPQVLWARRSIFFLGNSAILVTEVFLPQVLGL